MRPYLPAYLIHSILLCAASANTEGSSIPLSPSSTVVDTLGSETNTRLASHPTGQITTWDVGFSLRRDWADLGEEEECPVPPKLIIVHPDDSNGDQQVLEAVVSKLHSSIVAGVPEAFEALGKPFEETTTEAPKYVHEEFVSFEQWKRIKLAEEGGDDENLIPTPDLQSPPAAIQQAGTDSQSQDQQRVDPGEVKRTAGDTSSAEDQASKPPPSSPDGAAHSNGSNPSSFVIETPSSIKPPPASPKTLQNRYNYASPDCSARIHSSSPQTQHASSLLHKSRDRYMLTPCKSDQHWVVIELCDEIRIEAVEVAVWEFFSGVVRDIRVSVGGAEDDEEEEEEEDVDADVTEGTVKGRDNKWKEVGAFVGKNVRGFQTFTLSAPTSFHRFLRLDFPSHYGTEYYCPVSQVKVFGMNQMEAFKWEQKRLAATAKEREKDKGASKDRDLAEKRAKEKMKEDTREMEQRKEEETREKELCELKKLVHQQASRAGLDLPDLITGTGLFLTGYDSSVTPDRLRTSHEAPQVETASIQVSASEATNTPKESTLASTSSSAAMSSSRLNNASVLPSPNASETSFNETVWTNELTTASVTAMPASSTSTYSRAPAPRSDSSESIYAFIIRRLNALEGNSSLVARYIEEQSRAMGLTLGRVEKGWDEWKTDREGEDRGRWDQERMREEDRLGKVISHIQQHRSAMEQENRAMQSQLRLLADELGYERRRGLAQLFILLVIIFLGVATRSSTIDAVLKPLVAEARRRRSVYSRRSIYGPLADLRVDLTGDRAAPVIGQEPPAQVESKLSDPRKEAHPTPSPSPTPRVRTVSRSNSTTRRLANANTLRLRRQPSLNIPTYRSFPAAENSAVQSQLSSTSAVSSAGGIPMARPRASLTPQRSGSGVSARRLARSAHLHTIQADLMRDQARHGIQQQAKASTSAAMSGDGANTPRGPPSQVDLIPAVSGGPIASSPMSNGHDFTRQWPVNVLLQDDPSIDLGNDDHEGWSTDYDGTEASASEVEGALHSNGFSKPCSDKEIGKDEVEASLANELTDTWNDARKDDTQHLSGT